MSINGLLTDVRWQWTGTQVTADLTIGTTVIPVTDPECASEEDSVWIGGTGPYEILDADVDASTFTVTPGLTVAAENGDEVAMDIGGTPGKLWVAEVVLPDAERPVEVPLTIRDISVMRQGSYDPPVAILVSDDLERVIDVVGGEPSIDGGLIEEGTLPFLAWEWDDTHDLTSGEVTAHSFTYPLKHKGIASTYEFLAFVNGVKVPKSMITLDAAAGIVTVTLSAIGWETAGEHYEFHYAYTIPDYVDPDPLSLTFVGSTAFGDYYHHLLISGVAIPAGAQAGDIMIVGSIMDDPIIGGDTAVGNVTDGRMSLLFNNTSPGSRCKVYAGVYDGGSTTLAVDYRSASGLVNYEAAGVLYVFRPSVPAVCSVKASAYGTPPLAIPAVPAVAGVAAFGFTGRHFGGSYGWYWPGPWDNQVGQGTYNHVTSAEQLTAAAASSLSTSYSDSYPLAVLIGMEKA